MPTGYTAGIADGTVTSFDQFVWTCARNFGALIMMRDEPFNAPVPESFEPHTSYYDKALAEAEAERERVLALSDAELASEVERHFNEAVAERNDREKRRLAQLADYENMLVAARRWVPPTPEHDGLKEFMVSQLVESIDFDCRPPSPRWSPEPKLVPAEEWRADKLAELSKTISYHRNQRQSEIARTEGRNQWVHALRQSLTAETD